MTMSHVPRPRRLAALMLLSLAAALLPRYAGAETPLPTGDLIVELREVAAAGNGSAWELSSSDARRDRVMQRLRVRNGQVASLRLSVTRPVQTWQVSPETWPPAVVPTTQWISAGQVLAVQPRWPGGAQPVSVFLKAVVGGFDPHVAPGSGEPPQRAETQLATTVSAPLGAWITLATSGEADVAPNVVSSRDASPARFALQLRVTLAR
jgi:hypothetical protein